MEALSSRDVLVAILAANARKIDDDHIIRASRSIEVASNARASRLEKVPYCGALLFDVDDPIRHARADMLGRRGDQ
jgi:hypothetical protein